jgi:protein-S-isoprenylcysteine O-methyltransferase Ste14
MAVIGPGRARAEQRIIDLLLAGTALHWAAQTAFGPGGGSLVGLTMVALDLSAAALFAVRSPPATEAPLRDIVLCIGSVVAGGVALKLAPAYGDWPAWAAVVFALAGLSAIVSLARLGKSFAVFPSRRALVERGPYRVVRHPVYLAEATMVAVSALAAGTLVAALVLAVAIGLLVVRIRVEERFLCEGGGYGDYAARVRWRLVPGLW